MRLLFLSVTICGTAQAADWTVDINGNGDFQNIQDAVNSASPGDRIEVQAGTYEEAIHPAGKDLEFIAVGDVRLIPPTNPQAPSFLLDSGETLATIIDGFRIESTEGLGIWTQNSSVTIRNLKVAGLGETQGGALRQEGGEVHLSNSEFYGGYATNGGQIHSTNGILKIESSSFTENTAVESGGAIFFADGELQLTDCVFEENTAELLGGAIASSNSSVWLDSNQVLTNRAHAGGGIGVANTDVSSLNNTVEDNTGTWGAGFYISACYDPPEDTEVEESADQCSDNDVEGVLSLTDSASTFRDNVSLNHGGGIYLDGSDRPSDTLFKASFDQTVFDGNFADDYGGGLFAKDFVGLEFDSALFTQNVGESHGGGYFIQNPETDVRVSDSRFDRNVAYYGNGGAFYHSYDTYALVERSEFVDNRADDAGGAIFHRNDYHLEVNNSLFESNETEKRSGGAISFENNSDFKYDISLRDNRFIENSAGLHGGAVYANDARDITVISNEFVSNRAGLNSAGGAIMFWDQTAILVHNNLFVDNGAHYGGAAYSENTWPRVDGEASNLGVDLWTNNIFRDNRAVLGGGLSFLSNPLTDFRNNTLVGNVATEDASNLHLYASLGQFRNNLFAYSPTGRAVVAADAITSEQATFWSNAFWANSDGNWGEIAVEEFDGNLEVDPLLSGSTATEAPEEDSMVLTIESPLIDAGEASLSDPDESTSDIGVHGGPDFVEVDEDADGVTNQYDCDDSDPNVFPGATEEWYDGSNQDCSLGSDFDQDADGAKSASYGGPDCDDSDPAIIDDCDMDAEDSEEEENSAGGCGCSTSTAPRAGASATLLLVLSLVLLRRREGRE